MALLRAFASPSTSLRGAEKLLSHLRTLSTSHAAYGFGSHASDNDPKVIEVEKDKTIEGKKVSSMKSHPGWSESLASDSESAVKADKDDHHSDDHDEHLEKLQTHSVEHLKEVHKESK